ncbi:MAG: molybdopterin-binding protein [Sphingobium sp.]|jgi:DMSO/TMAO reductase YedYZ molybdopterin-dependent catalytic subunit|uniref:molybdopterin-binding protein n=1 Tax=unclassified Sphingobium TaxID=2611147 RepID=UPI000C3E7F63|nr:MULTISPECIES: molybdopterin-binding protein [unclassified Sphingobium]MBU0659045.1 molybdopterin-binding protein [Alphaproteobacteria bacterium]MBA4753214.1 molybdopterin-dependent oxidoreductase [Sphingobium sp.]MBG6117982.1 DMSO/TMAO reductase YedYZ molybdopterin-dependent catalytic subunit [Sphingobium sp. JAI105]MBS88602.1 molybdopterin-binding protein [Sphingobium sp.]MBU0774375.1 molybdopterin-binding protein [Alphaproteobacteria bacterium]
MILTRRHLLLGATATLAGCDRLGRNEAVREALFSAENFHRWAQRSLMARDALAQEFRPDQISPIFRANGTANPNTPAYKALWRSGFADWRLPVTGLVARPLSLSLAQLQAMPHRTQITRHDCVEGWSAIGKWRGVPLKPILEAAGLSDRARYLVFRCADDMGGGRPYYESIDRFDAFHPQTILAYALNDRPLTVANGAPLRLRVERQLGYKQAKYLMGIEAVATLDGIGKGKGGFWEDYAGYDWYAGI